MSRSNKKLNLLKPIFTAICLAMFAGTIFMAVDIATSGAEISKLERDLFTLETRNRELSHELIKSSSVSAMDVGAATLGFAKPEKTVYLTVEDELSAYAR